MPVEVTAPAPHAADALLPRPVRVVATRWETRDTVTIELESLDGDGLPFAPGQFTMLQAFGVGEVPISISGDPGRPGRLVHTIRDVGGVTRALCEAREGDVLGVRGPYGRGWGVSDGVGVPVHAATRARAAAPTVTPTRVRTRRTGERCGDMRALLGQGALPQKYPVRGRNVTSCRSLPPSRGVVPGARVRFRRWTPSTSDPRRAPWPASSAR